MQIRLLLATPDQATLSLLQSLVGSALQLNCLEVSAEAVTNRYDLLARVDASQDDVILLDWQIAEAGTPGVVTDILTRNARMRVVALLPLGIRQYRQEVWDAGACNSIPKEHMDQEWLSSILCVMFRAMQREARLAETPQANCVPALIL